MKNLFIIFCFCSIAATCQNQNKTLKDNPCDPTVMCTMDFQVVWLKIIRESGEAVVLDDFFTEIGGEKVEMSGDLGISEEGMYPVLTDGQMGIVEFGGTEIVFLGLVNEQVVVKHKMIVGKDCCHIKLMEGRDKVVL